MHIKNETKVVTTYIAFDGKVFTSMQECRDYEVSQLATFKRSAIDSKLVIYSSEDCSLQSPYTEDTDLTDYLKSYTGDIIWRTLGLVDKLDPTSINKVHSYFGLE